MEPLTRDIVVLVAVLIGLIMSGLPVAFAIALVAIGATYLTLGPDMLPILGYAGWTVLADFLISAIPLFMLMGYLVFESGLSTRLYDSVAPLLDRLLPGGLLHTNIVIGAVFAACSGSSVASCATIGAVALPEMESRGYPRGIAAGSVAAGSTLGILIPPSVCLILYGLLANQSIGKLFIGGIIPGLILTAAYMTYIAIRVRLQPHLLSGVTQSKQSWGFCLRALLKVWPVIILIIAVLGSIYTGLATPTEAAALGCATVFLIAAGFRLINWDVLRKATQNAVVTSSMLLMLILSGTWLGAYLSHSGITLGVVTRVAALELPPLAVFMGIMLMYLIMGCLMDGVSIFVLTIPVVAPVIRVLGYDLIWFGVVLTMIDECGLLTPPVGINLFILRALRPTYPFMEIVKGSAPFFLVILLIVFLMIAFPQLITFLPETMIG